jgi:hypothetical protein
MSVSLFTEFLPTLVTFYGFALTAESCLGIMFGIFELAFERVYNQVIFRMLLHLCCIPLGVYLMSLKTLSPLSTVVLQTKALLSFCILSVGCIGFAIGTLEIGVIAVKANLLNRMVIYALCIVISMPFLPLNP